MKQRKNANTEIISWNNSQLGDSDKPLKNARSENNMNDFRNPYNHITQPNNKGDSRVNNYLYSGSAIINRGANNLSPQYDIQRGLKSITHRRIAEGLAKLVAGSGFKFYIPGIEDETQLTAQQLAKLDMARGWLDIGLEDSRPVLASSMTYFRHCCMYINQRKIKQVDALGAAYPLPVRFNAKPSQSFRYCAPVINDKGETIIPKHAYHEDNWGFTGCESPDDPAPIIALMPIQEYITSSIKNKSFYPSTTNTGTLIPGYLIPSIESDKSATQNFVSVSISDCYSVFDNAYPIPDWKTNSSINSIQGEFEASCVNIDYLRNGLHLFAIVNIYSSSFKDTMGTSDSDKAIESDEMFNEKAKFLEGLKGSYNSGKIMINKILADDTHPDGSIEIKEIKLEFPVEAVRFFNEEARAGILTAWGVMADLFSISKPEKNNLRSQEGFMAIGIVLLQEKVKELQNSIERGIDRILKYYGLDEVKCYIEPKDTGSYMVVMREFAAQYMLLNEVREKIIGIDSLTDEQKDMLAKERQIVLGSFQQQGIDIAPELQKEV
jgi:hypothetical protein